MLCGDRAKRKNPLQLKFEALYRVALSKRLMLAPVHRTSHLWLTPGKLAPELAAGVNSDWQSPSLSLARSLLMLESLISTLCVLSREY